MLVKKLVTLRRVKVVSYTNVCLTGRVPRVPTAIPIHVREASAGRAQLAPAVASGFLRDLGLHVLG